MSDEANGTAAPSGSIEHGYGWVPSAPDFRDIKYTPKPQLFAAMPPQFSLVQPALPAPFEPAWNQGTLGSCGPHSEAANIVFGLLGLHGTCPMPSRLFLYYTTRMLMNTVNSDSGVSNREMLKALAKYGWCDEVLWPYDISKFTIRPPEECWAQAKERAGQVQYQAVNQDLNTMKACLYQTKQPIIFGFSVFKSMESPEVDKTGNIPMPTPYDKRMGGHDVDLVGWNDSTQRFILRNSWSPQWGQQGYGSIPYAYATNNQLSGDFWVVLKSGFTPPIPIEPEPPPVDPIPPGGQIDKETLIALMDGMVKDLNKVSTQLEWMLEKVKAAK